MWRQHGAAKIALKSDEGVEAIRINDHLRATLGSDPTNKSSRFRMRGESRTNRDDGFVLRQASDRLVRNRARDGLLEWLGHHFRHGDCNNGQNALRCRDRSQSRACTQCCLSGHCSRSRFPARSSDDENPSIGSLITIQGTAWYFVRLDQVEVMTFIVNQ